MLTNTKRFTSRILAFVMIISAMFTNVAFADADAEGSDIDAVVTPEAVDIMPLADTAGGPIDVWDFGGVLEEDTSLYTNHIDTAFLDSLTIVGDAASGNKGKFIEGQTDFDMNGILLTTNANDRLFYNGDEGIRSYGTNGDAIAAFEDGYTANGMWYANGTGGDSRRLFKLNDVTAGSEIKIYGGCSNSSDDIVMFDYLGDEGVQSESLVSKGGDSIIFTFIAKYNGSYKIWFDASGGKPVVNRIVRTPSVPVTFAIGKDENNAGITDLVAVNDATGESIEGKIGEPLSLTPGYNYTVSSKGVIGFGFTNDTRKISVTTDDLLSGAKSVTLDVEVKATYKAKGSLNGFADGYDTSKLVLTFVPGEGSNADPVVAAVAPDLSFEATLEPDVEYTATLEGVNDYEITNGGTFNGTADVTRNIEVALKAMYEVTGKIIGGASVKSLAFANVDDNYSYAAEVMGDTYSIKLRSGSYAAVAEADGYKTSAHVIVGAKDMEEDILFVPVDPAPPVVDTTKKDIYVGVPGEVNNYDTVGEALAAAKVINPQSEADRVTIHIAAGTYREQVSVDTPYITMVPVGNGEVKLTWYYGIGYRYYSVDPTGYYNEEYAHDKYSKDTEPAKWGTGVYVKNTAKGFRAEKITFEASFNKYITDEEIDDGVLETGSLPERNYALDVTSKAATERSTAISVEADEAEFLNCTFIGSQDTLYFGDANKTLAHRYLKNCIIEGNTDYIFGSSNAVFDGCELRFCGYSDQGMGGYITAGRGNASDLGAQASSYKGFLFRACTISNKDGMQHASGYFGRPWDVNSDITFLNTMLENSDAITAEGWTEMSGVKPDQAKFKEYGTMNLDGTPVDTSKRIAGTVLTDDAAKAIDAKSYFDGWTPVYYTEDKLPVAFTQDPYFSTDGDVLLPATGNTFTVKYSIGENDANDASKIVYSLVAEDGTETVIKNTTGIANKGVLITNDMIGSKLKIKVTPCTILGNVGEAKEIITNAAITLGSGSVDTERPSGKAVIFLAGDSTVKDYSAGAINNSGANRPEGSWGEFLKYFVDDSKYEVMDYAEGGRSTRTFMNDEKQLFNKIKEQMMAGDYLFIQFGHNDSSASYADRYVPVGTPDANGSYPYDPQKDTTDAGSGSFKWYLKEMGDAAVAVGATPVIVSPVSREYFDADGKITSHHGDHDEYVTASKQVAEENSWAYIDLYSHTKKMYEDAYAQDKANNAIVTGDQPSPTSFRLFAAGEKTHHSKLGGFAIAADLAYMIKNSDIGFANAIIAPKSSMLITAPVSGEELTEFTINNSGLFKGAGRNADGMYDTSVSTPYWDEYINGAIAKLKTAEEPSTAEPSTSEPSTAEPPTEATTSAQESTEEPTQATEAPTQAPTQAPTEATSQAATEAPSEVTTSADRPSSGGNGGGGGRGPAQTQKSASEKSTESATKTAVTEAATEAVSSDANTDNDTDVNTAGTPTVPNTVQNVSVNIGSTKISVNGKEIDMGVAPYIQASSNSTLVPLRFVAVALAGGDASDADTSSIISWDGVKKQAAVSYGTSKAVFTAGSNTIEVNGAPIAMDYGVVAEIKDDRMFIPFRAIGDFLGAKVSWDSTTKTASYN